MILRWTSIWLILVLQLCGLGFFSRGFFPKKLVLPGYSSFQGTSTFPEARFDKLILVVIDAFRSDFAFSESSSLFSLHSLLRSGHGIPFTAHSTPPTVTLPRIKGLTTGSTPNFLDAILNIAESDTSSTLAGQDNWLIQLKQLGKSLHMFGDDTWIKLFPGIFDRSDGTASFFVSDFTEVDNNVTRHLDHELAHQPDVLILHYLGLDHIGHKGGPESVFMPAKQREMDSIIEKLYSSMDPDTLLVVCGDHGMNEAGNHGGSSAGETSAAMAFLSRKFAKLDTIYNVPSRHDATFNYFSRVQQADLVPSLAALLNFPIPKNSLGIVLPELLGLWTPNERVEVLRLNALQYFTILNSSYPGFDVIDVDMQMLCQAEQDIYDLPDIDHLKCLWWKLRDSELDQDLCYEFLRKGQQILSKASSNYNEIDLLRGVAFLVGASVVAVISVLRLDFSSNLKFLLILISGLYAASLFGSSLVEEEHHFWYWGATGWLSWLYITSSRRKFQDGANWVICLILIRLIRGWNQTGQKYAGGPDTAKWLAAEDHGGPLMWLMIFLYYGSQLDKIWRGSFADLSSMTGFVFSFTTVVSSLVFKTNMAIYAGEYVPAILHRIQIPADEQDKLITLARLSFFTVGVAVLWELCKFITPSTRRTSLTSLSYLFEVFLVTQTRTCNIPLFILFNLLREFILEAFTLNHRQPKDIIVLVITFVLILQHVSFFAMGNSNSLASIDLSNAYNGVGSYNVVLVGVLTFVSNWVGPLYWSIAGLSMLLENNIPASGTKQEILTTKVLVTQLFFSVAMAGIMGACLALKHHLFIWTVFSPKLLYSTAWLLLQHATVDIVASLFLALVIAR
jgi:ethanolaminephosphotransferase